MKRLALVAVALVGAACSTVAPSFKLELKQVYGPKGPPPTLQLVYTADYELPGISQKCRDFNWLATGDRCQPTSFERSVTAVEASDGAFVYEAPEWVHEKVRHSLSSLRVRLPDMGSFDLLPLREERAEDGVTRAVLGEPFMVANPKRPGQLADARQFAATFTSDVHRLDVDALRGRYGLGFDGHTWEIDAPQVWVDTAGTLARIAADRARAAGPGRGVEPVPPACSTRSDAALEVWAEQGRPYRAQLREREGGLDLVTTFHFHDGELLTVGELGSERGATKFSGGAVFEGGEVLEWSHTDFQQKVYRRPWARKTPVPKLRGTSNAPPPGPQWRARIAACAAAAASAASR